MLKSLLKRALPASFWTSLRLWRARRRVAAYRQRQVRHTYSGFPLSIYLADPLAEGWYDRDWEELPEIALMRRTRLREGARVFDIGAHQGVVALVLSRIVGPKGRVLAVEPNAHNATLAERNRGLNQADNLTIRCAAVGEESGTLVFGEGLNGQVDDGTGAWGRVEVPSYSIDDLAREFGTPDILYVDVEGFEHQVLRGARETLRTRPDCFVEVHVGFGLEKFGSSVEHIASLFSDSDYTVFMRPDHPESQWLPFEPNSSLARSRFFLVAIARVPGTA